MPLKTLICCEKWCDMRPELGFTNSFHNTINSFSRALPDYELHTLHLDEAEYTYGTHVDNIIENYCQRNSIDLIIFQFLGGSSCNPSKECLGRLKEMGIYLCVFWPDTGWGWPLDTVANLEEIVDLNVSWDNPRSQYHDTYGRKTNHINMWTPEDDSLFYKIDDEEKDIPISFMGSVDKYLDRTSFLQNYAKLFPDMVVGGGQRVGKLTPSQYASVIRRSKVGINFPLSQTGVFYQAKGRIFEYTSCGGLLFDIKNPSTRDFYTPGVDFVEFETIQELDDKLKYYLSNKEERLKISESGYKKFKENYSAAHFWNSLINKIEGK